MRWVLRLCAIFVLLFASPAYAQRVALVIGESAYRTVSPLANPGADANLVAAAFARAGFDVRLGLDFDKAALETALDDFAHDAQQADVAAVYFAGHGFETGGQNWLVPIDAAIRNAADVPRTSVPFEAVARALSGAKVKLVALDACRNNPFAARAAQGGAINRGLAEVELDGYVIIYAAAVGAVALDGTTNSPFAQSFARWVSEPNVDLRLLAGRIRDDVMATTGGQQRPFVSASLSGYVTVLTPAAGGRVRGAASVRERPSAYFEFVRRVRDENCFETREVKCETKSFGLSEDGRIHTFEDDGKMRVWDASGAALQRAETPPAYERRAYARSGPAMVFVGPVLEMIGVNTSVEVIPIGGGRRTSGRIRHPWEEPVLQAIAGAPPVAVFSYRGGGGCRLGFADLRTFATLGEAVWEIPLRCGRGGVEWIFDDERTDRVIASVSNTSGDETISEVLLISARNARIICRIPGAAADAAFNDAGGFHVAGEAGTVVAYDGQCRRQRADRLHRGEVQDIYPFSRNRMLSRSVDGVVKVWSADRGQVERELSGLPRGARIQGVSSNPSAVLILNEDRRLYVWTGEPRLGAYVGPSAPVCSGRLTEDANTLYALTCAGALEVWRRRAS